MRPVVITVTCIVAVYATVNGISRPDDFHASLPFYAGQIGTLLLLLVLPRRHLAANVESIALGADVLFTLFLISHVYVPSTTITGASTTICMKMLTSASLLPWRPVVQFASSAAGLAFYEVALQSRRSDVGEMVAAMILPLLAGLASVAATAAADRRRRDAFEKGVRLEGSRATLRRTSDTLQREAKVKTALARVGRQLLSHSDRAAVLDEICRLTAETLVAQFSHVWLRDPADGAFVAVAHAGEADHSWDEMRTIRVNDDAAHGVLERLASEGVISLESPNFDDPLPAELHRRYGIHRSIFIGLCKGEETFGIVTAGQVDVGSAFGEVERRIADGIGQLASLALENARLLRDLEQANQLKQDFMATMSHELRTPLNAIIGYAALLQEGELGGLEAEALASVQRIHENGLRLLDMIQATLDLNRIDSGRLRIVRSQVQVAELMQELGRAVEHLVHEPVQLTWTIADALPEISTDPSALRTILLNLISNALKFTSAGWVHVSVERLNAQIVFTVADSGRGIRADALSKVFEPYWQATNAGSGLRQGFGLGLYIVQQLTRAIGAEISVASQEGVGSTFRLCLPIQPTPARRDT